MRWVLVLALVLAGCGPKEESAKFETGTLCAERSGAAAIPSGTFTFGSDETYGEERPAHRVDVAAFWLDRTEVSTRRFAKFVTETGYKTMAEREYLDESGDNVPPGGAVFTPPKAGQGGMPRWWSFISGANWRQPNGMDKALPSHPATQIAYQDAAAFAKWAGGRLPSEIEWEYAARAGTVGLDDPHAAPRSANSWQGQFPIHDDGLDGHKGIAPTACYSANGFGLYDMLGNVWEWTADEYRRSHAADAPKIQGKEIRRVIKGGSFLCAPNYCLRYRPAARQAQETGLGTNHIGFRVAYDTPPQTQ